MRGRRKAGAARGEFEFVGGHFVQVEFLRSGGVSYERESIEEESIGRGLRARFSTEKRVDDVELLKDARGVISRAYYVVSRHCATTPLGYFATTRALKALERDFEEVRALASDFNLIAREIGSRMRVKAEIYVLSAKVDDERLAQRLAGLVRERLANLRDAIAAGDDKELKQALKRSKNLDRLARGIQADSIRLALEHARSIRGELARRLAEPGAKPETVGKVLDVEPLEASLALFADPEGAIAEVAAASAGAEQ